MATMAELSLHVVAIALECEGSTALSRRSVRTPGHEVDCFLDPAAHSGSLAAFVLLPELQGR